MQEKGNQLCIYSGSMANNQTHIGSACVAQGFTNQTKTLATDKSQAKGSLGFE